MEKALIKIIINNISYVLTADSVDPAVVVVVAVMVVEVVLVALVVLADTPAVRRVVSIRYAVARVMAAYVK